MQYKIVHDVRINNPSDILYERYEIHSSNYRKTEKKSVIIDNILFMHIVFMTNINLCIIVKNDNFLTDDN